ncbi:MAG: DUF1688 family protein [Acetobacteraceae bacterium]
MPEAQAAAWLMTPDAVREQCNAMLALAERDALLHFTLDLSRLDEAADYVAAVTRANYPDLAIPYHARWRHFEAGGIDRWRALQERLHGCDATELARIRIDLCTVSVLLDAGAGPAWTFREPDTGQMHARSEGLAIASLHAFASGLFSGDPAHPLRADAEGLSRLSDAAFATAFQAAPGNPMVGVAGRLALLRNLGTTLRRRPELFGAEARIGGLLDHWRPRVAARTILATLLEALAAIWPGRQADMWPHPVAGMVPFHKLSQWLTYSMVEVLEQASITVDGLDDLTGLAEYRNGGLFLDIGVLRLREPSLASVPLLVDHPAIVEWRALTVALLDRLTPLLRDRLGLSPAELPLARVLQGGTWDAGRKIARERRADGGPPIVVQSDGTVF